MNKSDSIAEISKALVAVQKITMSAAKDRTNPHFKSKYADLTSVWDACRKPLNDNKLAITQLTDSDDGVTVTVHTMLVHESGEFISSSLTMKPGKADPQGIGGAITYARRYGLAALVGVVTEDDDGNAASEPPPAQRTVAPRSAPATNGAANSAKTPTLQQVVLKWAGMKAEDWPNVKAAIARAMDNDEPTHADVKAFYEANKGRDFMEACP